MAHAGPLIPVQIFAFYNYGPAGVTVLLQGTEPRMLPITIGPYEAQALLQARQQAISPEPIPYDLLQAVLERFQGSVRRLVIHSLRENIFYAYLVIDTPEKSIMQDCRPSDGMVMATRLKAPMYVTPEVMEEAGVESES